jgi:hypothetical protein
MFAEENMRVRNILTDWLARFFPVEYPQSRTSGLLAAAEEI